MKPDSLLGIPYGAGRTTPSPEDHNSTPCHQATFALHRPARPAFELPKVTPKRGKVSRGPWSSRPHPCTPYNSSGVCCKGGKPRVTLQHVNGYRGHTGLSSEVARRGDCAGRNAPPRGSCLTKVSHAHLVTSKPNSSTRLGDATPPGPRDARAEAPNGIAHQENQSPEDAHPSFYRRC